MAWWYTSGPLSIDDEGYVWLETEDGTARVAHVLHEPGDLPGSLPKHWQALRDEWNSADSIEDLRAEAQRQYNLGLQK